MNHFMEAERNDKLRGDGNRLILGLNEPGKYFITVPEDADIEIKLNEGNVTYASSKPTMLHIKAPWVNRWGDNGSSTEQGQSWDYYWGQEDDPKTDLKTKKGKIFVFHSDV